MEPITELEKTRTAAARSEPRPRELPLGRRPEERAALACAMLVMAGTCVWLRLERPGVPGREAQRGADPAPAAPAASAEQAPAAPAASSEQAPAGDPLTPLFLGGRATSASEEAMIPLLLEQGVKLPEPSPVAAGATPEGVSLEKRTPEPLSGRISLKKSLSGLFRYDKAAPDELLKVALAQKREVWMLARRPPDPPPVMRIERADAPQAAAAPAAPAAPKAGRKARVFRSNTRGTTLSPYAGKNAFFQAEQAASGLQGAAAGGVAGAGAPTTAGAGPSVGGALIQTSAPAAPAEAGLTLSGQPAVTSVRRRSEAELRYELSCENTGRCGMEGYQGWRRQEIERTFRMFAPGANYLFSPDVLALSPGRPVCRWAGIICVNGDGTLFPLVDDAYARQKGWPTESEMRAQGVVIYPSPIVLDLDGDGVRSSERRVRFDLNGDGVRDRFTDISSKDGILVFDSDGDGLSGEQARELFGTATDLDGDGKPDGFEDGFKALAAFIAKAERERTLAAGSVRDGWLDAAALAVLESRYGLRIRVGSLKARQVSLKEAGVARLRLSNSAPVRIEDFDGQGNDTMRQAGARFERLDGTQGDYEDLWFRARTPDDRSRLAAKPAQPKPAPGLGRAWTGK